LNETNGHNRLKAAGMKLIRRTKGHSLLDHRGNLDVLEESEADPVEKKLAE